MAKKAKSKTNTKKKTTVATKARRSTQIAKDDSKYDQSGAPWWKKHRPSEIREL